MKALVLFSGGLDSTTCLALAVDKYGADNVIALSVAYGQKHLKEIEAAQKIADYYKVKLVNLDLSEIFKDSTCTLLNGRGDIPHEEYSKQLKHTAGAPVSYYKVKLVNLDLSEIFKDSTCTLLNGRGDIPHEEYSKQLKHTAGAPVSTYVPFRNGLFLSSAAAIALSYDCEVIYYGAHADDAAGNAYPDTSVAFNNAINEAIYIGSGNKLKVYGPFISSSKADVVKCGLELGVPYELTWSCYEGINEAIYIGSGNKLKVYGPFISSSKADVVKCGLELGVPYELTWSCYEGHDKACGVCGTCIDRRNAFRLNNIEDPIEYEV